MGIRGLCTFFNNNPDLSKSHKLYNTSIVIDGNNLIHLLYFRNKVDSVYGGDYDRYAAAIRKYFHPFLECNIKPIIVFDGGYDKTNKKFQTTLLRSRTRLTLTKHIARYGECAGNVLPINSQEVFRIVLAEMNILFAQCDFEADDQITALANHYNCPVLSDDSDFYIFDLRAGFIRLSSLAATVVEGVVDGKVCKYLRCDIYRIDTFLSHFPGIDRSILPLFGTLIGNDFADARSFESFFAGIQLPKPKCKSLKVNPNQTRIVRLLSWLSNFSLNEGINQVLSRLKKERRDDVKLLIDQSVQSYMTPKCNLTHVIEGNLKELENILKIEGTLKTQCGEELPLPFVVSFHEGNLPSLFLNIINLHQTFLPAQVENVSLESSYACSRYVRQIIYGFLLQHTSANPDLHNQCCVRRIDEFDRRSGGLAKENVMPVFSFRDGNPLPNLCDVYSLKRKSLQNIISLVLDTEISYALSVPSNLQLLFASISYWLKNCIQKPREEFVFALVINLVYFNCVSKFSSVPPETGVDCPILSAMSNVNEADSRTASQNLKKYRQKPTFNCGNPLILHTVHCYSELQTCIVYSGYLNALLGRPFRPFKLHECFSGSLIYNLTKEMMSRPNPKLFVAELLCRGSALNDLFELFTSKILDTVGPECVERVLDRSHVRKGKKGKKCKTRQTDTEDLERDLQGLTLENFEDSIDESVDIFI